MNGLTGSGYHVHKFVPGDGFAIYITGVRILAYDGEVYTRIGFWYDGTLAKLKK